MFEPHRMGYWAMFVSVGVVLAGAIAVWRSARASARESQITSA